MGDLIEGIVALIPLVRGRVEDFRIGCGDISMGETPVQCCFFSKKVPNDSRLRVDPVLTGVLKCSRQCSGNSLSAVQGCGAVVYLSCTMRWHAPLRDTSQEARLSFSLWAKIAPIPPWLNCFSGVDKTAAGLVSSLAHFCRCNCCVVTAM